MSVENPAAVLSEQVGGDHYSKLGMYQPWEVLRHWLTPEEFRGFMKGNAIVYLARERDKGGDQDIAKAAHTLRGQLELGGSKTTKEQEAGEDEEKKAEDPEGN